MVKPIFRRDWKENSAEKNYMTKRTALVTGASGGIGYELARVLAREGHDLVLTARSAEKLEMLASELANKYAAKVKVIAIDLSLDAAPAEIFSQLQKENVNIDMLVNNAGFGLYGSFHDTSWEKEKQMIDLNIRALTELTKLFVKSMVSRRYGRILNVASTAAF